MTHQVISPPLSTNSYSFKPEAFWDILGVRGFALLMSEFPADVHLRISYGAPQSFEMFSADRSWTLQLDLALGPSMSKSCLVH